MQTQGQGGGLKEEEGNLPCACLHHSLHLLSAQAADMLLSARVKDAVIRVGEGRVDLPPSRFSSLTASVLQAVGDSAWLQRRAAAHPHPALLPPPPPYPQPLVGSACNNGSSSTWDRSAELFRGWGWGAGWE